MEASTLLLTILIPILACSLYYMHHLKQQITQYETERDERLNIPRTDRADVRDSQDWLAYLEEWGTSAWCQGTTNVDRRCIFRNLCYHTKHKEFVFLHASRSVMEGIPDDRQQPALADLSSVPNHNTQYFGYVDVPSMKVGLITNVSYREGKFLLFNRFNPGNLMHVIHDDLLPVFYSQLQLGLINRQSGSNHATLLMNDDQEKGPYFTLYEHISEKIPILTHQLSIDDQSTLVCFEEVHIGLSKLTTWYQYGFDIPQGPLDNIAVTAREIKLFTSFYRTRLKTSDCEVQRNKKMFVMLSRRTTRLILNEVEISLALAQHFDAYVIVASLETHSLSELVGLISCAQGLIGVHGSLLSLAIFLPPSAVLVEIFPYGINPDRYTPYRTLARLPGMNIIYVAWRNVAESNTVTHPDAEPEFGGIAHLDVELQQEISSSSEVLPHLCCNDPAWLYRIYQDTIVNVNSFVETVRDALLTSQEGVSAPSVQGALYQPGAVVSTSCYTVPLSHVVSIIIDDDVSEEVGLLLSWKPPWNIPYIHNIQDNTVTNNVEYEVTIQEQGEGDLYAGAFILYATSHLFRESFKKGHVYFAWIRCKAGGRVGPYVALTSCPYKEDWN